MLAVTNLTQIGLWILYISIPIIALYLIYLIITKAFNYMGFTSIEAIIIVFVSLLFGFEIIILDFNISNIYLFSHGNWRIGINMGGAIIPILLSVYLIIKKKISLKNVLFGIIVVSIISVMPVIFLRINIFSESPFTTKLALWVAKIICLLFFFRFINETR